MFDILVFKADLPYKFETQKNIELIFNPSCIASSEPPTNLPSTSEAPYFKFPSTVGTELKPKPPPSPNIVVLGTLEWSEVTKILQMSF